MWTRGGFALAGATSLAVLFGQVLCAEDTTLPAEPVPAPAQTIPFSEATGDPLDVDTPAASVLPGDVPPTDVPPTGALAAPAPTPAPAVGPAATPADPSWWENWNSYPEGEPGEWRYETGYRRYYASLEWMISWGKTPGDNLIGSQEFSDLYFFPTAPNSFPHQNTGDFNGLVHLGVRGRLGYDNADDSGVQVSGFHVFKRQQEQGPGRLYNGSNIYDLSPLASFPLDDGGDGTVVPFDSAFMQKYDQRVFGADIDAYLTPLLARDNFQLRVLLGAKYLQVDEWFDVTAGDSGLGYTVNTTNNTIDYSTVEYIGIAPYEMQISSSTRARMVGPSVGFRYDWGDSKFKIWGQTKFALAASFQESNLSGVNVVNGFQAAAQEGPPFAQSSSTTRVSPILDTSIYADMYLFAMLPLVRDVQFLRNTQFRIGFDYLLVGEVGRPANVIRYNTPTPALKGDRTSFSLTTLTLGLNWNF